MDAKLLQAFERLKLLSGRQDLDIRDTQAGVAVGSPGSWLTGEPDAQESPDGSIGYDFGSQTMHDIERWTTFIAMGIDRLLVAANRHGPLTDVRLVVDDSQEGWFMFRICAQVCRSDPV